MRIKKIKWRDSRMYLVQEPMQNFDVSVIESVGFVIQEDKQKIVLAGDLVDGEFRRVISIPKENIVKK